MVLIAVLRSVRPVTDAAAASSSRSPFSQPEPGVLQAGLGNRQVGRPGSRRTSGGTDVGDDARWPRAVIRARDHVASAYRQPATTWSSGSTAGIRHAEPDHRRARRTVATRSPSASMTLTHAITATRSQSASASSVSWVTSDTVVPWSFSCQDRDPDGAARPGPGPGQLVQVHERGRLSRARTRTALASPPLSEENTDRRRCVSPNCPSSSAVAGAPGVDRSSASATLGRSGSAEDCELASHQRPELLGLCQRVEPSTRSRPSSGLRSPCDALHGGRLAAPLAPIRPTISPAG